MNLGKLVFFFNFLIGFSFRSSCLISFELSTFFILVLAENSAILSGGICYFTLIVLVG